MDLKRVVLFLIFVILSISVYANGYTTLQISSPRCFDDGTFTFTATNKFAGELNLNETLITVTHQTLGYDFMPNGTWSKDVIFYETGYTKQAEFTSNRGMLKDEGNYAIEILYEGCKNPPCKEVFALWRCPGFPYNCDVLKENIKITKCFPRGDKYYVYFEGLNKGQFEKINVLENVRYYVSSNSRNTYNAKRLEGQTIEYRDDDSFILSFDLRTNERINEVALSVDKCDSETSKLTFACKEFILPEEKEEEPEIEEEEIIIEEPEESKITENKTAEMRIHPTNNKIEKDSDLTILYLVMMAIIFALLIIILILIVIKQSK